MTHPLIPAIRTKTDSDIPLDFVVESLSDLYNRMLAASHRCEDTPSNYSGDIYFEFCGELDDIFRDLARELNVEDSECET